MKHIKTSGKKTTINIGQIDAILKYIENNNKKNKIIIERDKLIFKILYYTGIKTNDLLKIKKLDCLENIIKLKNNKITIDTKLSNNIKEYLKLSKIENNQYLFFSFAGNKRNFNSPLTQKSIQDFFKKYTKHIDNNLSIIDLRNSYFQNLTINSDIKIDKINSSNTIKNENEFLNINT